MLGEKQQDTEHGLDIIYNFFMCVCGEGWRV